MVSNESLARYNFKHLLNFFRLFIDKHDNNCQLRAIYYLAEEARRLLDQYRWLLRLDYDEVIELNLVLEEYLCSTVRDLYWQAVSYVSKQKKWIVDFEEEELEEFFGWLINQIEGMVVIYLDSMDDYYEEGN